MNVLKTKPFTFMITAILLVWSCESVKQSENLYPISEIDFSFLQASNKLFISAKVTNGYQGGTLDSVMVLWKGISIDTVADTLRLMDDGTFGDILSKDQVFSRKIVNDSGLKNVLPSSAKDSIFFSVMGFYSGKKLTQKANFILGNIRPVLGAVFVPDTVTRPTSNPDPNIINTVKFSVTARVSDLNGLEDIKRVFFKSYHVGLDSMMFGGNRILLYDDGSGTQGTGDFQKGDGMYTMTVSLNETATTGTYHWTFEAQDLSNAYSESVNKILVVK